MDIKEYIIQRAVAYGFGAVGFTGAEPLPEVLHLREAISTGRIASMGWLARNVEKRCDPRSLLPGAKSVICAAMAYGDDGIVSSRRPGLATMNTARFARGEEYHKFVRQRLVELWQDIDVQMPGFKSKICVDTSPILEKALAMRAGIGWIGRHTVLVSETLGSWFVLGEIMTDLPISPDRPAVDRCGDCTACIDACPTGALISSYKLDAGRCISYLTIEHKGEVGAELAKYASSGLFGCDICQEACPYNATGRRI
jgi:epoxyqueuosine reductase